MEQDFRRNPALVKLDLFCRGLRLAAADGRVDRAARPRLRTRAGLGSGIDLVLPHGLWVNAPVDEPFAAASPWRLAGGDGGWRLEHDGGAVIDVRVPAPPTFYGRRTRSGRLMSRVAVLQGTYLAVYPTRTCANWTARPRQNCGFCSLGLNLGVVEDADKSVDDVVETALAAREEAGITFVHFNTGWQEGDTYLDDLEPFVRAVRRRTGLLVGVQTPPHPDLRRYDALRRLGVDQVSFCLELWDEQAFRRHCPGKAAHVGRERHLAAIAYCARRFATTNGEIIAGLEPPAATIEAIDWITGVGAVPTVCVFRPLVGTDLAGLPPPATEAMVPVFRRLWEACSERRLPIGIAPNVEVGIVLKPEECRWLSERRRPLAETVRAAGLRLGLRAALGLRRARARLSRAARG